jgi:MFS family permease
VFHAERARTATLCPAWAASKPLDRRADSPQDAARGLFPVALRQRQFRLYWTSTLVSDVAQWAQLAIQAWLILELSASPLYLGLYTVSRFLPKFLLTPIAGVAADRMNRLRLLFMSQGAVLSITLALAVLFSSGIGGVWGLLALNSLLGAAFAFDQPARRSLLPNLVERRDLLSAVSLNNSAFNIAVIAGPIVATLLLSAMGSAGALYINAVLFALSLILLLQMTPVANEVDASKDSSIRRHFWDGLKYMWSTPLVGGLMLVSLFPGFLDRLFVMFLPLLTHNTTPMAETSGDLIPLIRGVGAVVGALVLATCGTTRVRGALVMPVALSCAATSALFIFAPWLALSMGILLLAGVLRAVLSSLTTTMLHTIVPDTYRGRVMAI